MNRSRKVRLALATCLLPLLVGASLVGYSPMTCGCIPAWEGLASSLGLSTEDWRKLTPTVIAQGFDATFRGKVLTLGVLPQPDTANDCVARRGEGFRCRYWLWDKGSLQRGVRVDIFVTAEGLYRNVRIIEISRDVSKKAS